MSFVESIAVVDEGRYIRGVSSDGSGVGDGNSICVASVCVVVASVRTAVVLYRRLIDDDATGRVGYTRRRVTHIAQHMTQDADGGPERSI